MKFFKFKIFKKQFFKSFNLIVIVKPWFYDNVLKLISWLNLGFNFFPKFFGDAFAPLGNANAPPMGAHLRPWGRICVTDQTV